MCCLFWGARNAWFLSGTGYIYCSDCENSMSWKCVCSISVCKLYFSKNFKKGGCLSSQFGFLWSRLSRSLSGRECLQDKDLFKGEERSQTAETESSLVEKAQSQATLATHRGHSGAKMPLQIHVTWNWTEVIQPLCTTTRVSLHVGSLGKVAVSSQSRQFLRALTTASLSVPAKETTKCLCQGIWKVHWSVHHNSGGLQEGSLGSVNLSF
jgi:hypothetical protein